MKFSNRIKIIHPRLKYYILSLAVMWTLTILAGLILHIKHEHEDVIELAKSQARIAYEKDIIYRRWNTMHGGVYVPVTEETQPNAYMSHIPERDVTTTSNRELTLMNPDYMMRQVRELAFEEFNILGHITSLNPTRAENTPDPWERASLKAFEQGETEVSTVSVIGDTEYVRLIRPIYTEEGCMQCHATQVYEIGDIRGGLSVAVPMEQLNKIKSSHIMLLSMIVLSFWAIGIGGIFIVGRRLIIIDNERRRAEETLIESHEDLKLANMDLEALNKVSAAISQTINLNELLDKVLETIVGLKLFSVERKGGIFIIENDRMRLISHLGHPDAFLNIHKDMRPGDCLCGLSAKTGEVVMSKNSEMDSRHTMIYSDMTPHGHIIVPLKSMNNVIGVLYLYTPADSSFSESEVNLLRSIGNQIGIAIENSRLYEETKELSLRDPLTGLANRRLMQIVFERSYSRSRRLERPLSIMMLDIDHFKKYNDTYGHTEGDKILVAVAKTLLREIREIDLCVRYGGEEFLILLPDTESEIAREIAERIRRTVKAKTDITVSIGVASHGQESLKDELIAMADDALYQAKQKGRNRVEVAV